MPTYKQDTTSPSFAGAINEAQGINIASATPNIGAATGNYVNITGTTTITAFDTVQAGTRRILNFNGSLTLTYNATSLILPSAANIITAAGDTATFISLGSGNWICTQYSRASGNPVINSLINNFRITLVSGTSVTTTDITYSTAQTLYCTQFNGNQISLFDGSHWSTYPSAEMSIALGTLVNAVGYDVFCYANSGVPTLELLAWTNSTTRATALVLQNGVYCKTGALTRRYLGSFYNAGNQSATVTVSVANPCVITYTGHNLTANAPVVFTNSGGALPTGIVADTTYYVASIGTITANTFNISATVGGALIITTGSTSGTNTCTVPTYTEDSALNRFVFNYCNFFPRLLYYIYSTGFTYTLTAVQIWNANLAAKLNFFVGIALTPCSFEVQSSRSNSTANIASTIGIGNNSITAYATDFQNQSYLQAGAGNTGTTVSSYTNYFPIGLNYAAPLQSSTATGTCTWAINGSKFSGNIFS